MKKINLVSIIIIAILLNHPLNPSAIITPISEFIADDNGFYKFDARADIPLSWNEDSSSLVKLNLTLVEVPDENSGLRVLFILFNVFGDIGSGELVRLNESDFIFVDKIYNQPGNTTSFEKLIRSPNLVDNFKLNITIMAITTGNDTSQDINNPREYTISFPDELNVKRDRVQALVDLYGFPPNSFFAIWIPIVSVFSIIILLPTFYAGAVKGNDYLKERKLRRNQITGAENTE